MFCQWFLKQSLSVLSMQLLSFASSQRNLCSPLLLLFLETCFVFFVSVFSISPDCLYFLFPPSLYSFPPPIDIRPLAFKNQSCCSFSALILPFHLFISIFERSVLHSSFLLLQYHFFFLPFHFLGFYLILYLRSYYCPGFPYL